MSDAVTDPAPHTSSYRLSNPATLRTFIAINVPSPLLDALNATQTALQTHLAGQSAGDGRALRWSPRQNLHLTLRFLGDTTLDQQAEVTMRLTSVAATVKPFTICVNASGRALGGFPNLRQPRVLWTGVEGDLVALRELQAHCERVAQAVGFAPDPQPYTPHLTLARTMRDADRRTLGRVGKALATFSEGAESTLLMSFTVEQIVFYQSQLRAGGSHYLPLAEFSLTGS
jgi:2'-5' RNA ligase